MITVKLNTEGKVLSIATDVEINTPELWQQHLLENRNDWKSFDRAEEVAAQLSKVTGEQHQATDAGSGVYPRYDVQRKPQVGDEVSHAFNGDYTPDGVIVRVSKTGTVITTSNGTKYYRKGQSGSYKKGCFSLVHGHIEERNPHF